MRCMWIGMLVACAMTGNWVPKQWDDAAQPVDFFTIKGVLERLAAALHVPGLTLVREELPFFHPSQSCRVRVGETSAGYLGLLQDKPPAEYPPTKFTPRRQPEQTFGPVAPVWRTVSVPRDALAATYTARVTVRAEGQSPVTVPLQVEVVGWTLPEPGRQQTWVELMQSPDTLAMEYNVEPWSERHWALIARSLRQMRDLAQRSAG